MRFFIVLGAMFALVNTPVSRAEYNVPALVDSIYAAEGGARAKKPFGILSVPCSGYAECRRICTNTVRNNIRRWESKGRPGDYLDFLGARYAPVSAHPLNRNWVRNVRSIYERRKSA